MHDVLFVIAGSAVSSALLSALRLQKITPMVLDSVQDAIDCVSDLSPTVVVLFAETIDETTVEACCRLRIAFGKRAPPLVLVGDKATTLFRPAATGIDVALPTSSLPSLVARRIVQLSSQWLLMGVPKVTPVPMSAVAPECNTGQRCRGPLLLLRVLYVSRSLIDGGSAGNRAVLADIVDCSRRWNAANDITGALIHAAGYFVQVLEGRPSTVETLLEKIRRDTRHFDMRVRQQVKTDRRLFGSWALMGAHLEFGDPSGAGEQIAPFDADPDDLTAFLQIAISSRFKTNDRVDWA